MWLGGSSGDEGADGSGRMREDERTSTMMWLMWSLNSARPSKIMFDIGPRQLDKKIKSCIILEVF